MCVSRNVHISKFNIAYLVYIQLHARDEPNGFSKRQNTAVPYAFVISNYEEHGPRNSQLSQINKKPNVHAQTNSASLG